MKDDQSFSLVDVKDLRKYFQISKGRVLKAVDGVNFVIRKGEVLGLVGESGCGKTTIGRLILRLLNPTSGEVLFKGKRLYNLSKAEMRRIRRKMQIVFHKAIGH